MNLTRHVHAMYLDFDGLVSQPQRQLGEQRPTKSAHTEYDAYNNYLSGHQGRPQPPLQAERSVARLAEGHRFGDYRRGGLVTLQFTCQGQKPEGRRLQPSKSSKKPICTWVSIYQAQPTRPHRGADSRRLSVLGSAVSRGAPCQALSRRGSLRGKFCSRYFPTPTSLLRATGARG